MDAYVYKAALICAECAIPKRFARGRDVDTTDSDSYPQGPYSDGGGESDCPQHCDVCGVFLENSLTPAGMEYVANARESAVSEIWREFYDVDKAAA